MINLSTMAEMEGDLPRKQLVKALAWATEHRSEIEAEWKRLNAPRKE